MFFDQHRGWIKGCAVCGMALLFNGEVIPYVFHESHLHHLDKHAHQEAPAQPVFQSSLMSIGTSATASVRIFKA